MAETATSETEPTAPQPEALSAKRAASTVSTYAQLALGSFATFSGLLYAMGYLLTLGQMRMLGAGTIDVSNQDIVRQVISIPLLSLACAVVTLLTLEGLMIAGALSLVCLNAERFGLYRQQHVTYQTLREVMLRWGGPLVALIIVSLFSTGYLSPKILDQRDVLLKGPPAFAAQGEEPERQFLLSKYDFDLHTLKASQIPGRQVYGFQVWAIVFCLTVLVGLWITLRSATELSRLRQTIARLTLGIASILVLLQFLNVPFLYGYLVMDSNFPAIATSKFPAEAASNDRANRLLLIGAKGGKYIVYSPESQQMWRGVAEGDLLPAIQLPPQDPFLFENPFPSAAQIESVSISLSDEPLTPTAQFELFSILLPATKNNALVTRVDSENYTANWQKLGSLVITTHKGLKDETLEVDLYDVHEEEGDETAGKERFHFIAFKLSIKRPEPIGMDAAKDDAAKEEKFEGRTYKSGDQPHKLTRGSYYYCRQPFQLKKFLEKIAKAKTETETQDEKTDAAAEADHSTATPGPTKPDATSGTDHSAEPAKDEKTDATSAAEAGDSTATPGPTEPDATSGTDHSAEPAKNEKTDATSAADHAAADVDEPVADPEQPAEDVEPATDTETPQQHEDSAEKQPDEQTPQPAGDATKSVLEKIRLKTK